MIERQIHTIEDMIPWIHLHRTHLKQYGNGPATLAAYTNELWTEYDLITPFLPPQDQVKSILDIGCGLAGIDILLQRHYPDAKLYLLDSDGPASDWGAGWNAHFKPFNSMKLTHEFLHLNGINADWQLPTDFQEDMHHDLVISFLSWGFHYSLFKYRVKTSCAIATIRKGLSADELFYQTTYKDKNLGKSFELITETDKYHLIKFSFDNVTSIR